MADAEGGGRKVFQGLIIAVVIVAALVLLAVFYKQVGDALGSLGTYVQDHIPADTEGKATLVVYLILSIIFGVLFSKAGHFVAYGIVVLLLPLLWVVFWEGFPPLGLKAFSETMGIEHHLGPTNVILWAVIAAVVITLVFVPLEIREKFQRRRHKLAPEAE
jgi:hypothetical protein